MPQAAVEVAYKPFPWQAEVHKGMENAQHTILSCGRRTGKTELASVSLLKWGLAKPDSLNWWVGPTYKNCRTGYRRFVKNIPRDLEIRKLYGKEMLVELAGNRIFEWRSADKPDNLRGDGLDSLVIDEMAHITRPAWEEILQPALEIDAKFLGISSPRGKNFFWELWMHGQRKIDGWISYQYPRWANPKYSKEWCENLKKTMTERAWLQEIAAQFIENQGSVFRKVRERIWGKPLVKPRKGRTYAFGLDWGKANDFTVIQIIDITSRPYRQVAKDKMTKIDYNIQTARVKQMAKLWNPIMIHAESNAMGEVIIDRLRKDLPNHYIRGYFVGKEAKPKAIEGLSMAIETGDLLLCDDPDTLLELDAYEFRMQPSGATTYGAPHGIHDDHVMALAVGLAAFPNYVQAGVVMI